MLMQIPKASPAPARALFAPEGAEILELPDGAILAKRRRDLNGVIELVIECFDRHGMLLSRETATIRGAGQAYLH